MTLQAGSLNLFRDKTGAGPLDLWPDCIQAKKLLMQNSEDKAHQMIANWQFQPKRFRMIEHQEDRLPRVLCTPRLVLSDGQEDGNLDL